MELFTQQNGQYIAAGVIEVIAIPHFDLLATMPEEAVARVDATFLGMLSGFANRVVDGSAAYEMLMVSEPHQTSSTWLNRMCLSSSARQPARLH